MHGQSWDNRYGLLDLKQSAINQTYAWHICSCSIRLPWPWCRVIVGRAKANIQCWIISTTKQAASITLATTVGLFFVRDLDFANIYIWLDQLVLSVVRIPALCVCFRLFPGVWLKFGWLHFQRRDVPLAEKHSHQGRTDMANKRSQKTSNKQSTMKTLTVRWKCRTVGCVPV